MPQKTRLKILTKLAGLFQPSDLIEQEIGYEGTTGNLAVRFGTRIIRFGAMGVPRAVSGAANIVIDVQNSMNSSFSMYPDGQTATPLNAARTISVNAATFPDGATTRIEIGADGSNRVLTFPQTGSGINHFLFNATNGTDRNRTVNSNQRRIILLWRSGNSFYWTFDIYR